MAGQLVIVAVDQALVALFKPIDLDIVAFSHSVLTTPRMAAFSAWQSPPLVSIPIFNIFAQIPSPARPAAR